MPNLASALNASAIAKALSGGVAPRSTPKPKAAGFGGTGSPKPKVTAVGMVPRVAPTVQDMLSRPKRTRRSGYEKTAPSLKAGGRMAAPNFGSGKMTPGAAGPNSAGPGTGGY